MGEWHDQHVNCEPNICKLGLNLSIEHPKETIVCRCNNNLHHHVHLSIVKRSSKTGCTAKRANQTNTNGGLVVCKLHTVEYRLEGGRGMEGEGKERTVRMHK